MIKRTVDGSQYRTTETRGRTRQCAPAYLQRLWLDDNKQLGAILETMPISKSEYVRLAVHTAIQADMANCVYIQSLKP